MVPTPPNLSTTHTFSPGSDAEWEYFMDATQTILHLKAGQVLTAEQVAEILFVGEYERRDHEHAIDVFHKGYEAGRLAAAGAKRAKLLEQIDALKSRLAVAEGLLRFYARTKNPKPRDRPLRATLATSGVGGESTGRGLNKHLPPETGEPG